MIYVTDSDGNGEPCVKVHEGKFKWYFCKDEKELLFSLTNLLKTSTLKFKIYNVLGKEIPIPNNKKYFEIDLKVNDFSGIAYNPIKALRIIKEAEIKSLKLDFKPKYIHVKFRKSIDVTDIIKLDIRIVDPIEIPNLY